MKKNNEGIRGFKTKVFMLLLAAFIFGGAMFVTMYASGSEVIEKYENMFMVSHTEYRYGEAGQIVVRLVDFSGGAVAVNNCTALILNPDKSIFLGPALMNSTGTITGDHYYEFTTPNGPEGVYEYQATCTYAAGTKVKSATNSFHLSGAFNTTIAGIQLTLDNLAALNNTVVAFQTQVQDNFSQVQASIASINVTGAVADIAYTLAQTNVTVNTISSNLDGFIIDTAAALSQINTTVNDNYALSVILNSTVNSIYSDLTTLNTTMSTRFDAVDQAITDGTAAMAANVSDLKSYVSAVNDSIMAAIAAIDINTTPITDAIYAVNASLSSQISGLSLQLTDVNLSISNSISDFRQEVQVNLSALSSQIANLNVTLGNLTVDLTPIIDKLDYMNATQQAMVITLANISTGVSDTYSYMTGTLASNINDILGTLGIINATVNRIEQNTLEINTTTKQILQNQEDEVFINTYSG